MATPEAKIYNDAPDEFAEFLDSGHLVVTRDELGGQNNPFIKEGIYREADPNISPNGEIQIRFPDGNESKVTEVKYVNKDYAIDHNALAEFMSRGLGCKISRQFKKTGWQFGKLRGYDVYFACVPTAGMYRALESAPKSVLIIGQNNPETLPSSLATRVIYLSRLLFVKDGTLQFANEVVEEKIPMPQGGGRRDSEPKERRAKGNPKRWPIQMYAPHYLKMMAEWFENLRREKRVGRPPIKWIADWMYKHNASPSRKRLSERQIYRHITALTEASSKNGKPDRPYAEFVTHWYGCEDSRFVDNFTGESLADVILKLFPSAKLDGNDIKPMRDMDAADFADKCDGKFGQKRNYRTHVD